MAKDKESDDEEDKIHTCRHCDEEFPKSEKKSFITHERKCRHPMAKYLKA